MSLDCQVSMCYLSTCYTVTYYVVSSLPSISKFTKDIVLQSRLGYLAHSVYIACIMIHLDT